jgi:hypothetical protein
MRRLYRLHGAASGGVVGEAWLRSVGGVQPGVLRARIEFLMRPPCLQNYQGVGDTCYPAGESGPGCPPRAGWDQCLDVADLSVEVEL